MKKRNWKRRVREGNREKTGGINGNEKGRGRKGIGKRTGDGN